MSVELQELINFHLTGRRGKDTARDPGADFCPALLAPYRDLTKLRYDFPLVLLDDFKSPAFADTLTGIFNRLLRDIAPKGNAGEPLRQHVLRLERRMRELVADGSDLPIEDLWKKAEKSLLAESREDQDADALRSNLGTARFALKARGKVVDCDILLPERAISHAWSQHEARRAAATIARLSTLIIRLRNMLRVDDLKSTNSRTGKELKKSVGKHYKEAFDFDLMSDLLGDSTPRNHLPAERRSRIKAALAILENQRFFAFGPSDAGVGVDTPYRFMFDSLPGALKTYHERLEPMAEVIKAMAIAELECDNAYNAEKHAAYFERYGAQALTPEDLSLFPSYLVVLHESESSTLDTARLMEIVSCDLPIKVMLQVNDAFGESPSNGRDLYQGSFVQQLAHTLMAPGNAYVLQSTASAIAKHQDQIRKGLEYQGPAIFSIFAPVASEAPGMPAYLVAAAALESRVFPSFSYDPSAGGGLKLRFNIGNNPEPGADWIYRELHYEDKDLQSVREETAFTPADFAVTSRRNGEHFAAVAANEEVSSMVSVAEYLDLPASASLNKVPFVSVVDQDNRLIRLVVDEAMIRRVRRCRERWHALQELGGEHNSYAEAARAEAEAQVVYVDKEASPAITEAKAEAAPEVATAPAPVVEEEPEAVRSDDAWIETPRCTTCDECTQRNDRMFAYDDNKQAYIKDINAGTYKDLVEAAENCQVAIIHPGKPRNPDEPGLADLIKRAEPFQA